MNRRTLVRIFGFLLQLVAAEAALLAWAQARIPSDTEPNSSLTPGFTGDNIAAVVASLASISKPRSEFETTMQYEARRSANSKSGSTFTFVLDKKDEMFTYDADAQI